jgi:hypothetical protein
MCPVDQAIYVYVCIYHITAKNEPVRVLSFARRLLFRLFSLEIRGYVILQADRRNISVEH